MLFLLWSSSGFSSDPKDSLQIRESYFRYNLRPSLEGSNVVFREDTIRLMQEMDCLQGAHPDDLQVLYLKKLFFEFAHENFQRLLFKDYRRSLLSEIRNGFLKHPACVSFATRFLKRDEKGIRFENSFVQYMSSATAPAGYNHKRTEFIELETRLKELVESPGLSPSLSPQDKSMQITEGSWDDLNKPLVPVLPDPEGEVPPLTLPPAVTS